MSENLNLGLDAKPLVPLLGDGQLHSLALGQRDERLVALANDKDVGEPSGKDMALGILDVDNVEWSRVLLPGYHGANTTSVGASSDHAKVSDLEDDDVLHFVGGQVQLNAVVHLGVGVRVPDGATIAGRVGTMISREKHPGSFDIVHIKDSQGHVFATRLAYVFVIGKGNKPFISLPKGKGVKLSIAEERDKRLGVKA